MDCTYVYFIKNMNIVPASRSDEWQRIRVSAYLSLNCENMVRAVGALIKYLEKHYNSGLDMDDSVELGMICSCCLLSHYYVICRGRSNNKRMRIISMRNPFPRALFPQLLSIHPPPI